MIPATPRDRWLVLAVLAVVSAAPRAQDSDAPQQFGEFRGTWRYDAPASDRTAQLSRRIATTIVIATSPTAITLTKDAGLPEVYLFDGSETQTRDPRTGAPLEPRYSFRIVAGALALIYKSSSGSPLRQRVTNVVADAYRLADFDTLTVERQVSVVVEPPGSLRQLGGLLDQTETLVYRRCAAC